MDHIRDLLVEAAIRARDAAYAPYSKYAVGAALWTPLGEIVTGANVENASYGLTVCAERNAIFRWVASPRPGSELGLLTALAVAAGPQGELPSGGRPCGACLQVIREFAIDLPLYIVEETGVIETRLSALLPDPFRPPFGPTAPSKE